MSLTFTDSFEYLSCGNCGIRFAVPDYWYEARKIRKECNGEFYCPNGHPRIFAEPEVDKLRKQLAQERAAHDQTKADRDNEKFLRTKSENKYSRLIKTGCCPCCRRNFQNLRRHIKTKHPEYVEKLK